MSCDITRLLRDAAGGDDAAFDRVAEWAYGELERLAASRMRHRFGSAEGLTLEPAALVNETFMRLLEKPVGFENRRHFLAFASSVMVHALADYDRGRRADKRYGRRLRVTWSEMDGVEGGVEISNLSDALDRLEAHDLRKAEVVKLRILWGCGMREIARLLDVSLPTVERDWRFAKVWLAEALGLPA